MNDQQHPTPSEDELPPELREIAHRYVAQTAMTPSARSLARFLGQLPLAEISRKRATVETGWHVLDILHVVRWRIRLLGPWFWIASVCLLGIGALFPILTQATPTLLIALAPLTVVMGLAHAVPTSHQGLRAVEYSCPIGSMQLAAGLALAIMTFDCLFGLLATVAYVISTAVSFSALLVAWLGPLLLLTGLSLPIALRWGAGPAAIIGGGPWVLLALLASLQPQSAFAEIFAIPASALALQVHLLAAAIGALLLVIPLLTETRWRLWFPMLLK